MQRRIYVFIVLLFVFLSGCGNEMPTLTINNKSQSAVLVRQQEQGDNSSYNILQPNDKRTFFFPAGLVRVSVIKDTTWAPEIKAARDLLEEQLTQARNSKQPAEIRKIQDHLEKIDLKLASLWQDAKVASCDFDFGTSSCEESPSSSSEEMKFHGSVVIEERNGLLTVSCSTR